MLLAIQSIAAYLSLMLEAEAVPVNLVPIGAALTMLVAIGAGLSMGLMTSKAVEAIARQPEAGGKIRAALMLGLAFTEMTALLAFVIAMFILIL